MGTRPNVALILADDMGFSDLGCFGSRIRTPHLDALAARGVVMSQFYNTARCSPSRASLLTGVHPHQTGIGVLTHDDGPLGYPGTLNDRCVTMAEVLKQAGYGTYLSGKWHLSGPIHQAHSSWPTRRGFDRFYGILAGAATYYHPATLMSDEEPVTQFDDDFYLTTALGDRASRFVTDHLEQRADDPFFLYLAFTAPHWPLHAPEEVVASYRGVFDDGWDVLRQERYQRMCEAGFLNGRWPLGERDADVLAWEETADQAWQARRMEVYAAQVELMDAAVGGVVETLAARGELDNTLIMFCSDNGGCAEEMPPGWVDELPHPMVHTPAWTPDGRRVKRGNAPWVVPGAADTYASYGRPWANVSNTPFREYKHWVHEGGIATPLLAHWPAGLSAGDITHQPHQLPDVMATVLQVSGVDYPEQWNGRDIVTLQGRSMLGAWRGAPAAATDHSLYFEHEGNAAIRRGRWKLVRRYPENWELFDLDNDRTEETDLSGRHPEIVRLLASDYQAWADRAGVLPREQVLELTEDTEALTNHRYLSSSREPHPRGDAGTWGAPGTAPPHSLPPGRTPEASGGAPW